MSCMLPELQWPTLLSRRRLMISQGLQYCTKVFTIYVVTLTISPPVTQFVSTPITFHVELTTIIITYTAIFQEQEIFKIQN